jgi:hypothetical protein
MTVLDGLKLAAGWVLLEAVVVGGCLALIATVVVATIAGAILMDRARQLRDAWRRRMQGRR